MWKLFLIILFIITSCVTVEKRLYRLGYHISYRSVHQKQVPQSNDHDVNLDNSIAEFQDIALPERSDLGQTRLVTGTVDHVSEETQGDIQWSQEKQTETKIFSRISKKSIEAYPDLIITPIFRNSLEQRHFDDLQPVETKDPEEPAEKTKMPWWVIMIFSIVFLVMGLPGAFYPLITGIVIAILSPILGGMSGGLAGMIAVLLWGGAYIAMSFMPLSPLAIYFIGLAAFVLFAFGMQLILNAIERKSSK